MKAKLLSLLLVFLLWIPALSWAQGDVEMADIMRSDGKIYVVVVVATIVMTGILTYLFFLDRKISRLEEKIGKQK